MTELREWLTFLLIVTIAVADVWLVKVEKQIAAAWEGYLVERRNWYNRRLRAEPKSATIKVDKPPEQSSVEHSASCSLRERPGAA